MHIAEGVLSLPVLLTGAVTAIAGTAYGLRKLSMEAVPRCGIVSASLFVASLIHVNLGVSSVHLLLNGSAASCWGGRYSRRTWWPFCSRPYCSSSEALWSWA